MYSTVSVRPGNAIRTQKSYYFRIGTMSLKDTLCRCIENLPWTLLTLARTQYSDIIHIVYKELSTIKVNPLYTALETGSSLMASI